MVVHPVRRAALRNEVVCGARTVTCWGVRDSPVAALQLDVFDDVIKIAIDSGPG
jgi:hypothetical protein